MPQRDTAMSTATTPPKSGKPMASFEQPLLKRYSPHHEFPLSTLTSITLHALVIGVLALIAFKLNQSRHSEEAKPPKMDVVEIEGGGGLGGLGIGSGPGPVNQGGKTEVVAQNPGQATQAPEVKPREGLKFHSPVNQDLFQVPMKNGQEEPGEAELFQGLLADARLLTAQAMKVSPSALSSTGDVGSAGRERGSGGGAGGGEGTGIGTKKGPGTGTSPTGVLLTKRERRQKRWRIDFSGDGPTHLKKLQALRVTLAIPSSRQGMFMVYDLARGMQGRLDNLVSHKDKVQWFNTSRHSLQQLASVMRLPQVPPFVVIFLPEAVEEEMHRLEHEYRGLEEHQITFTEFEIRQRPDGSYGPVVVAQR